MADSITVSSVTAAPVAKLITEFNRLPGIGPKSAQRLAYHILRASEEEAKSLAAAILDVKARVHLCAVCQNTTESETCTVCRNPARDRSQICVVEEPLDILALEKTGVFKGLYHVLHGVISPLNGITAEDLKVRELMDRLKDHEVTEVIMAVNPSLEGDVTALYLERAISPLGIRVTRLARGLPVGADLGYADEITITRALEGRQAIS